MDEAFDWQKEATLSAPKKEVQVYGTHKSVAVVDRLSKVLDGYSTYGSEPNNPGSTTTNSVLLQRWPVLPGSKGVRQSKAVPHPRPFTDGSVEEAERSGDTAVRRTADFYGRRRAEGQQHTEATRRRAEGVRLRRVRNVPTAAVWSEERRKVAHWWVAARCVEILKMTSREAIRLAFL